MATGDEFINDLIRQRTYGGETQPWTGFPTRGLSGRGGYVPPSPLPPTPSSLLQGMNQSYAPRNYAFVPEPLALPSSTGGVSAGAGAGAGTGLAVIPSGLPGGAATAGAGAAEGVAAQGFGAAARGGFGVPGGATGAGILVMGAPAAMTPLWEKAQRPAFNAISPVDIPEGGLVDQLAYGNAGAGVVPILPGPVGAAVNAVAGLFGKAKTGKSGDGGSGEGGGKREMKDVLSASPTLSILNTVQKAVNGGLLPEDADPQKYLAYYNVLKSMGGDSPESQQAALSQVNELIAQDLGGVGGPEELAPPSPQDILAQQAQVAQTMAPYAAQAQSNNQQRVDLLQSMAANLPPEYSSMRSMIAQQGLAQSDLVNAYAMQANLIPQTLAMEQSIQERQGIANQLHQQSITNILYPPQQQESATPSTADALSQLLAQAPQEGG